MSQTAHVILSLPLTFSHSHMSFWGVQRRRISRANLQPEVNLGCIQVCVGGHALESQLTQPEKI